MWCSVDEEKCSRQRVVPCQRRGQVKGRESGEREGGSGCRGEAPERQLAAELLRKAMYMNSGGPFASTVIDALTYRYSIVMNSSTMCKSLGVRIPLVAQKPARLGYEPTVLAGITRDVQEGGEQYKKGWRGRGSMQHAACG